MTDSAGSRIWRFLFGVGSDSWLTILRIGLGLEVILYAVSARGDWNELFASGGNALVNREIDEAVVNVESAAAPRIGWLVWLGHQAGVNEPFILWTVWFLLIASGCCLLVGFACRSSAITAWFFHLCCVKSADLLTYGLDNFTTIGLFYLVLSPLPDRASLDALLTEAQSQTRQVSVFVRRVLQTHLSIVYFFSGFTKIMGVQWWNGTSLWRALISPPYNVLSPQLLISWKYLLPVSGVMVCLLETSYPIVMWLPRTRKFVLLLVIAMHITIGLTMRLYLFSLIMIILNLAAFGPGFAFSDNLVLRPVRLWPSKSFKRAPQ